MNEQLLKALSAIADGEAGAQDWRLVEAAWAKDPTLRERWLAWHEAGDALRSPELARPVALPTAQLLQRLQAESVEQPWPQKPARGWLPPLAVAASFVAMALLLSPLREMGQSGAPVLAAGAGLASSPVATSFAQRAAGAQTPDFGLADPPHGTVVDAASWTPPPLWPESGASTARP